MIKYFQELEDRQNYYLPLINTKDRGVLSVSNFTIPHSFFAKYQDLFTNSHSFIHMYKNFDINKYFIENIGIGNYDEICDISNEYEKIAEELDWVIDDYNKINVKLSDIEWYFKFIERILYLFSQIYKERKEYYENLRKKYLKALKEFEKFTTIKYNPIREDNIYLTDAWFITQNKYLYNTGGKDGHRGTNLIYSYQKIKEYILNNRKIDNNHFELAKDIKSKKYITSNQFKIYLNYLSQPNYLTKIEGSPVTYENHIVNTVLGIVNARACFYEFFKKLQEQCTNPVVELNKIIELTNDDIGDVLVRCCGFHKIESQLYKTITTSCINYEYEFSEYIKKGWKIHFVPPIIINHQKKIVEYPNDFLSIRKILKK